MFPGAHAEHHPDRPAIVMRASGEVVTYAEIEDRSRRLAQHWYARGLRPGDHVALMATNHVRFAEVYWAAMRSGLYFTAINRHLTAGEAAYIVTDSGAKSLVVAGEIDTAEALAELVRSNVDELLSVGEPRVGYDAYEAASAAQEPRRLAREPLGEAMLYSSGTTGRPKGIERPLSGRSIDEGRTEWGPLLERFGFSAETVYLSPAPLYHSAPLGMTMGTTTVGGSAVVMDHFDAEDALAAIGEHAVTTSQWVPTMFVRMLKLDPAVRSRAELSTHRVAIHAAAPCPGEVKRQMIEWWGPILIEYYGGTELNGLTIIDSDEWSAHPGSVGRAVLGTLHVCDESGHELQPLETGLIYFELAAVPFTYHNDPEQLAKAQHPEHPTWTTLGDVGHVDADGYLYLTDRSTFMVVSGGVNIYPQEIEDVLVLHPEVLDVAVFGVPNDDLGEEVKAVVQPSCGVEPGERLRSELLRYAHSHLASFKVPRSIDFVDTLPRSDNGKLYKRLLRDPYWAERSSKVI